MITRALSRILCFAVIFLFSSQVLADNTSKKPSDELVFGILPFLSPVALIKRFTPLKDYLEKTTGKTIFIESAPNFPEFVKRAMNHQYDIVFTAPHFVPVTLEDNHYQLLAASNKLAAHILVKKDSNITSIEQLSGKRVSHGPKQAFVVIIAKYLLKSKGLTGKKAPEYILHKSHNAALRAVMGDEADAAIVGTFLLKPAESLGLREIANTDYFPGIAILTEKDLPKSLQKTIADTFISMKGSEDGRKTLKKIGFPGFQKTTPSDYDALKPIAEDAFNMKTFEFNNQ